MASASSKILSSSDVRISHAPVRVGGAQGSGASSASMKNANDGHNHEPEVSLEHDAQGNVATIRIRCRCGEELTIACDYPRAT